ncbi:hypothetical protein [Flavihumibacter petaseus]|uniref:Uncharacterized protein n=1 Tax=Flavihumibacter petaseus NBRC 106054 TaxID=1220578 RepID=A0A0E9N6F5_9BACT|nr:hypothetical protein [Flavihumibacter petaseus]GAO45394.1 hypothetical protein FPE01S_05_00890 [Flavihumibacter petaseus NBRC 106054]
MANKTIVSAAPRSWKRTILTPKELAVRVAFMKAIRYVRRVKADPEMRAWYIQANGGNRSVTRTAFNDMMFGPELSDLRMEGYDGGGGQNLVVKAEDNFRVWRVVFALYAADGSLLETGEAVCRYVFHWVYTTQKTNPLLQGMKIRVIAWDLPGNEAVLKRVL